MELRAVQSCSRLFLQYKRNKQLGTKIVSNGSKISLGLLADFEKVSKISLRITGGTQGIRREITERVPS